MGFEINDKINIELIKFTENSGASKAAKIESKSGNPFARPKETLEALRKNTGLVAQAEGAKPPEEADNPEQKAARLIENLKTAVENKDKAGIDSAIGKFKNLGKTAISHLVRAFNEAAGDKQIGEDLAYYMAKALEAMDESSSMRYLSESSLPSLICVLKRAVIEKDGNLEKWAMAGFIPMGHFAMPALLQALKEAAEIENVDLAVDIIVICGQLNELAGFVIVSELEDAVVKGNEKYAEYLTYALISMKDKAVPSLNHEIRKAAEKDDMDLLFHIINVFKKMDAPTAVKYLIQAIKEEISGENDSYVRSCMGIVLGSLGDPSVPCIIQEIKNALALEDKKMSGTLVHTLTGAFIMKGISPSSRTREMSVKELTKEAKQAVKDNDKKLLSAIIKALIWMGEPALNGLTALMQDEAVRNDKEALNQIERAIDIINKMKKIK